MPEFADTLLQSPLGAFALYRFPRRKRELLRAWDAADEYLLRQLHEESLLRPGQRILILNDSCGALAVALHEFQPVAQSDSFLSQQATRQNLEANGLAQDAVSLIGSLEAFEGVFDLLLIKVPKTLALLEHQLIQLRSHVHADTRMLAAGMIKAMPDNAWRLLARILGPTRPSKAWKKARLIHVQANRDLPVPHNPYPVSYALEGTAHVLSNHANVFSRDSLDIGTRLLLKHLPEDVGEGCIVDLACGNGVVGLVAAERNPQASLYFVDESFMAVTSAETNFRAALGESRQATFAVGDGLSGFPAATADVVLCNPPFHQQSAVGTQVALQMFRQAKQALKPDGALWLVANRHLRYERDLGKLFGAVEVLASNAKFLVFRAYGG